MLARSVLGSLGLAGSLLATASGLHASEAEVLARDDFESGLGSWQVVGHADHVRVVAEAGAEANRVLELTPRSGEFVHALLRESTDWTNLRLEARPGRGEPVWVDDVVVRRLSGFADRAPAAAVSRPAALLTDWQVAGPFVEPQAALETDAGAWPVETQRFETDARGMLISGRVTDVHSSDRHLAYFRTRIDVSDPRPSRQLVFSTANDLDVWLNGRHLAHIAAQSYAWVDVLDDPSHEAARLPAPLAEGENWLVVRVNGDRFAGGGFVAGLRAAPVAAAVAPTHVVDLTHAFGKGTIYWPSDEKGFELEVLAHGETDAGFFYSANRFCAAEHGGTHLDAPIHFSAAGHSADTIPVRQLVGPGAVVDVSAAAAENPDYLVAVADFEAWEREHGRLPDGAIVLLRTGWAARWQDRAAYLGTARTGPDAVAELHFPGLAPAAARWLATERSIAAVGLDTPSIDHGPSTLFESHVALFAANIPALENVAALDLLPAKGFVVAALPMKIEGGSGGPLRIVAWW